MEQEEKRRFNSKRPEQSEGTKLVQSATTGKNEFKHPPIIMDLLFAFKQWYGMHQHLPKLFRITISTKMLEALSECMELCVMINFSRKTEKEKEELNTRLLELRGKIELLKAYALVSWEMKFISHGFYGQYSERLENISKQAASWHAWFVKR